MVIMRPETQAALAKQNLELTDVQDRNIMYNPVDRKITIVDISLRQLHGN